MSDQTKIWVWTATWGVPVNFFQALYLLSILDLNFGNFENRTVALVDKLILRSKLKKGVTSICLKTRMAELKQLREYY